MEIKAPKLTTPALRLGFTIIELLVTIGVIAILISLLMPAVQQARAAVRKTQCQNKLRQLGLAIHEFESTYRMFPAGRTSKETTPKSPEMSWLTALLPYVEHNALYERVIPAFEVDLFPYTNPPHVALGTPVTAFGCPEDSRVDVAQPASALAGAPVALTSYIGVSGLDYRDSFGVLYLDSKTRFRDITDGTTNTLLAGERPPSPDFNLGWWYTGRGQDGSGNTDMMMGVNERVAEPFSRFTAAGCPEISSFSNGRIDRFCDTLHFWSLHSGGSNFLFCDGSVRFMQYGSAHLIPALATRSGAESE